MIVPLLCQMGLLNIITVPAVDLVDFRRESVCCFNVTVFTFHS